MCASFGALGRQSNSPFNGLIFILTATRILYRFSIPTSPVICHKKTGQAFQPAPFCLLKTAYLTTGPTSTTSRNVTSVSGGYANEMAGYSI